MTYLIAAAVVLVTGFSFTWLLVQAAIASTLYAARQIEDDDLPVLLATDDTYSQTLVRHQQLLTISQNAPALTSLKT